jgi:hypothetical protein
MFLKKKLKLIRRVICSERKLQRAVILDKLQEKLFSRHSFPSKIKNARGGASNTSRHPPSHRKN